MSGELIVEITAGDIGARVRVPMQANGASPFAIADAMGACCAGFERAWQLAGAFTFEGDDDSDDAAEG